MAEKTKVKFNKDWKFAHGGINVQEFVVAETYELDGECLEQALKDKVAVILTGKAPEKTGAAPAETGTAPAKAGTAPAETGTAPAETA